MMANRHLAMLVAQYGPDTVVGELARDLMTTRGMAVALLRAQVFPVDTPTEELYALLEGLVLKARERLQFLDQAAVIH